MHCSDTPNGQNVNLKAMEKSHMERGFTGIGYHAVIQPDGEFEWTRGINEVGEHVAGANTGSIGVCLAGRDKFTRDQFERLRNIYTDLVSLYPSIRKWEIYGHCEFPSAKKQAKSCPNININILKYFLITNDYECLETQILAKK